MIRVVVADDHPVVRGGLIALLAEADDIEVVGQAGDGNALVQVALELQPDVVLTDLRMPGIGGAEATRRILAAIETHVLILTTYETDADILAATEAGATGYLLKAAPPLEIFAGIRAVAKGERAMAPSVARALAERPAHATIAPLSAREQQVLTLMKQGSTNAAIGVALFIGEATVKSHVQSIFAKLGVRDRTSAVAVALQRGLV